MRNIVITSMLGGLLLLSTNQAKALSLDFKIDEPYLTAVAGQETILSFYGTVTASGFNKYDMSCNWVKTLDQKHLNIAVIAEEFKDGMWVGYPNGVTYSGLLFTLTVDPNDEPGDYFYTFTWPDYELQMNGFKLGVYDNDNYISVKALYGVRVVDGNATPEPVSLVAVGIGLLAVARKRRKKA